MTTRADAAPADSRGTRTRAGNNMSRSRVGILAGASECILKFGTRKTTMGDIARVGGVAKATLYNHFRDKRELYAALVAAEVDAVIAACDAAYKSASASGDPLAAALAVAARRVSEHPVLRHIATSEPLVLGALVHSGDLAAPGWSSARAFAGRLVGGSDAPSPAGDLALRWVVAHAGWPASGDEIPAASGVVAGAARALAELPSDPDPDPQMPSAALTVQ